MTLDKGTRLADLHVHSVYSDGEDEPAEIVRKAGLKGLSIIGVSDHDSISGVREAIIAGEKQGVEVIPATELSAIYNGADTHVLGYFIDTSNPVLLEALDRFANARRDRAEKMVKKLRDRGLKIEFEDVERAAGKGTIGRPHIALAMIKNGSVRSMDEAFYNYIGFHCAAYVRKYEIEPAEAAEIIHEAGGLAVLAHPLAGRAGRPDIIKILDAGLDGIEFRHPRLSSEDSEYLKSLAEERSLLLTGGSDYHGEGRGPGGLGECAVPAERVVAMKEALRGYSREALIK